MLNFKFNQLIKQKQLRTLLLSVLAIIIILVIMLSLVAHKKPKSAPPKAVKLTGVLDESFTNKDLESAITMQQALSEKLAKNLEILDKRFKKLSKEHDEVFAKASRDMEERFAEINNRIAEQNAHTSYTQEKPNTQINFVSFRKPKTHNPINYLNPAHYVPSNTSVRAVVLGGADADASVYGQSRNNGVMLFKLLDDGALPNGKKSHLRGCRVSANTFGDISSERALATLYRLSCVQNGKPIIDKEVTGWVFYNGKVGIKGKPLMRDSKIMTWAGISGALSGVSQAAQAAQSMQQFGSFGITSIIPSQNVGQFAAYGGASKATDKLSEYYIKRAEQYHPVIQVGAGNIVTIVFKDGFYLDPEDPNAKQEAPHEDLNQFNVPPEVLNHINNGANQ